MNGFAWDAGRAFLFAAMIFASFGIFLGPATPNGALTEVFLRIAVSIGVPGLVLLGLHYVGALLRKRFK